jgi:membrane dipeptidase
MAEFTRRAVLSAGFAAAGAGMPFVQAPRSMATVAGGADSSRLIVDGLDVSLLDDAFLGLLHRGGVHCVHQTVGGVVGTYASFGKLTFGSFYEFLDAHADQMVVATSVRAIRQAREDHKLAFVLGWQDANLLDARLRESQSYTTISEGLRGYAQLGLRIVGLCYQNSNLFGGGCLEPREPLTRAGRRLVEEIHKKKLILDVGGHTGEQTSLDAISISTGVPIVSTHTCMASINPNVRCISDRLAVAIAGTGGVIGVNALSDFHNRTEESALIEGDHSPQASLEKHLDQYDYLRKLVGVDHIGLGPDFTAGISFAPAGKAEADDSLNWTYGSSTVGPQGTLPYVKGYENISQLPNLISGLAGRGWTDVEIGKVLGGNWLRVYERVWGA